MGGKLERAGPAGSAYFYLESWLWETCAGMAAWLSFFSLGAFGELSAPGSRSRTCFLGGLGAGRVLRTCAASREVAAPAKGSLRL
ncbi:MAG: hypothetical protein QXU72_08390 [Thermofilum sp.]